MTTKNGYNGYANYETWIVVLWLESEQGTARYWRDVAYDLRKAAVAHEEVEEEFWLADDVAYYQLAARLKAEVTDEAPDLGASLYSDLMQAAFSDVDWHQVAGVFFEQW